MKLVSKEVDKRLIVKLNKNIKDDKSSGIMMFGENNDYPQILEKLINGSQTGKSTSKVLAKFIGGDGFSNPEIGKIIVGKDNKGRDITLDKIRRDCAVSFARNNGVYIHTNINLNFEIVDTKILPFKTCRFSREDDNGFCSRIAYNKDWELNKNYKKDVIWFNIYTSNVDSIKYQIENAGGIDKYKGQVYFSSTDSDDYLYPLSIFDQVYLDLDTEYQIQLFKNRQIRNGFTKKVVMNISTEEDETEQNELNNIIQSWIGPDGDSVLVFQSEFDDSGNIVDKNFKVDTLESNIDDKLFENWEKSLANSIRKSAHALPAVLIDYEDGKLSGTSGEAIIQATKYYNAITKDFRTHLAEVLKEVYSNHTNPILRNNTDWNILPVQIIEENKTNV